MHKRFTVLIHFKLSKSTNQLSVLWNGSYTSDLWDILNTKCLDAAVIENTPHFYHTFCISSYEAVQLWNHVNTNKRVFMTIQFHYFLIHVRIPNKNLKVETATDNYFMFFAISKLSNSLIMTLQNFNWRFRGFIKKFFWQILYSKVIFELLLFFAFFLFFILPLLLCAFRFILIIIGNTAS